MAASRYFVAEVYDPAGEAAERTARVAAELARQGARVCLVESLFSPDDELSLQLFQADSAETVAEVGRQASTPFDRIWPAERVAALGDWHADA